MNEMFTVRQSFRTLLWSCLLLPCMALTAEIPAKTIVYARPIQDGDSSQLYQVRLLAAALNKMGIRHQLVASEVPMVQGRSLRTVAEKHGIDVFWSVTTTGREQLLTPVRFPIDKGLYGWRILLLSPQQAQSAPLLQLNDLKKLLLTQGHDWPDTEILRFNKLKVVPSNQYSSMFEMVSNNRVDAFPRSVLEIWREQAEAKVQLPVEASLVLYYPTALYYFFSREQQELAHQVEQGLELMLQSGEFEAMFMQEFGDAIARSKLAERHLIQLRNPLLPTATPLDRTELWYIPTQVQ
ncbi:hypothetical protein [Rheinheimera tilapiae]|uniref:Transporter substrate-binding domain-containing protein n=1 Tax=Rheinheimera tilapiae TaxID=875043 RepID=A0ABV6BHN9_9GAMM